MILKWHTVHCARARVQIKEMLSPKIKRQGIYHTPNAEYSLTLCALHFLGRGFYILL